MKKYVVGKVVGSARKEGHEGEGCSGRPERLTGNRIRDKDLHDKTSEGNESPQTILQVLLCSFAPSPP